MTGHSVCVCMSCDTDLAALSRVHGHEEGAVGTQ